MSAKSVIDRFKFERALWKTGVTLIAGVDEAGCGPLAGPVVAAAVILPCTWLEAGLPKELEGLNDSKKLSSVQRERFFIALTADSAVQLAIARVEADWVDRLNILRATHRAMHEALAQLQPAPQHVLVDGRRVKTFLFPQTPLVEGDARSYAIAAASVLAKVTRDRLMIEYDRQWPAYGFATHKGYGTARHLAALAEYGPCPIHRRSFTPMRQPQQEML